MKKKCFMCGNEIKMMDAHCITNDQYYLCYKDSKKLFPQNRANKFSISMKTATFVQKHTHDQIAKMLNEESALANSSSPEEFRRESPILNKLNEAAQKSDKMSQRLQEAVNNSELDYNQGLNIVQKQFDKAGVSDLFGTKKEVKELPNILDLNNEVVKYAASGIVANNTVLVVCTNKRILFIDKGFIYGIKTSEIPLDMVNGVSYSKGLLLGTVSVTNGANTTLIENIEKQPAEILADTIKEEAFKFKKNSSDNNSHDFSSQLRELKSLLDDGIITEEEFKAKKKQILNL